MRRKNHRCVRGMSLIEIMIVLVIMGMIASVVTWNVLKVREQANKDAAVLNIRGLRQAVIAYRLRTNEFPESLEVLADREIERNPVDPWGSAWIYEVSGEKFTIRSAGPDQAPNTEDDVTGDEVSTPKARRK